MDAYDDEENGLDMLFDVLLEDRDDELSRINDDLDLLEPVVEAVDELLEVLDENVVEADDAR